MLGMDDGTVTMANHLTFLPGPDAPAAAPVTTAHLSFTVNISRTSSAAGRSGVFQPVTLLETAAAPSASSSVQAVVVLWMERGLMIVHACLGPPYGPGWMDGSPAGTEDAAAAARIRLARETLGWRACWTGLERDATYAGDARPWLQTGDQGEATMEWKTVERGGTTGAATPGDPLKVWLRIPAQWVDVENVLQTALVDRHGVRPSQIRQFEAAPIFESRTGRDWREIPITVASGPTVSPITKEPGVLLLILVKVAEQETLLKALGGTTVAHLLEQFPLPASWDFDAEMVRVLSGFTALPSPREVAELMRGCVEAPRPPPWTLPTCMTNASVLQTAESVAELRHPWLPQALEGFTAHTGGGH